METNYNGGFYGGPSNAKSVSKWIPSVGWLILIIQRLSGLGGRVVFRKPILVYIHKFRHYNNGIQPVQRTCAIFCGHGHELYIYNDLKPIFNHEIPKDLKVVSNVSQNVFSTYPTTSPTIICIITYSVWIHKVKWNIAYYIHTMESEAEISKEMDPWNAFINTMRSFTTSVIFTYSFIVNLFAFIFVFLFLPWFSLGFALCTWTFPFILYKAKTNIAAIWKTNMPKSISVLYWMQCWKYIFTKVPRNKWIQAL